MVTTVPPLMIKSTGIALRWAIVLNGATEIANARIMSLILIWDVSSVRTGSVSDRIDDNLQMELFFDNRLSGVTIRSLSLAVLTRDGLLSICRARPSKISRQML
jgi:hypothetical protein